MIHRLCRPAAVADKGKTFILETYKLLKVLYREVVSWAAVLVTTVCSKSVLFTRTINAQLADIWAIRATWEIVRVLRECLHEIAMDIERSDTDVQKVRLRI